jgi:predicted HAD superfamily phosphohydrolase YqeG
MKRKSCLDLDETTNSKKIKIDTEEQINCNNYKIFAFDLDNTLYLHNADKEYTEIYYSRIKKFLKKLKHKKNIIYNYA